jgi:hypothetical protein
VRRSRLVDVSWLHWLAPAVGVLLLGFLWVFVAGVRTSSYLRHHPPIDGVVLALLLGVGYLVWPFDGPGRDRPVLFAVDVALLVLLVAGSVVAGLAWANVITLPTRTVRPGHEWAEALYSLPDLIAPSSPLRALCRWSRPLWWCLRRPRVYGRLRRLGVRGVRGVSLVGQWFTPAQVVRLGWPGPGLHLTVGGFGWRRDSDLDTSGWTADAFIRAVHATGRPWLDYTTSTSWRSLHRLGVEDTAEFVRYARAGADLDEALRYGLAAARIPYDVFPTLDRALERAEVQPPERQRLLDELVAEAHRDLDAYQDGWAGLAAWVGYDGAALVGSLRRSPGPGRWDPEPVFERWRSWRKVAGRAPGLQPALWDAAGLTLDEALTMIDAGDPPDAEVLAGLAALRRPA